MVTVLCGGNIDLTVFGRSVLSLSACCFMTYEDTIYFWYASVLERGLAADGRLTRFVCAVSDRPGGVAKLTKLVSECGASLKDIYHERAWLDSDVNSVQVGASRALPNNRGKNSSRAMDWKWTVRCGVWWKRAPTITPWSCAELLKRSTKWCGTTRCQNTALLAKPRATKQAITWVCPPRLSLHSLLVYFTDGWQWQHVYIPS